MNVNVETIHNHRERAVFATVGSMALRFPAMDDAELLADIACFSLNRLSSRYIRHEVDFAFMLPIANVSTTTARSWKRWCLALNSCRPGWR